MTLTGVTHVGAAPLLQRLPRRPDGNDTPGFFAEGGEHPVRAGAVEALQSHVVALHDLVGHRGAQESDRRSDAGVGRYHDAVDPELLCKTCRMQRGGTAKCNQRVIADAATALDRMHSGSVGHALVHDLADAARCDLRREVEWVGDGSRQREIRCLRLERHGSGGEPVAVDASEHQVRVGDGRVLTSPAVAGRPRLRTRALRPHRDLAELVDASHRAAARPDLDHLDHRNPQRQPASLEKTGGAVDLETPHRVRGEPVDQADLRGGATHVEGDDLFVGALGGDPAGQHRPARLSR